MDIILRPCDGYCPSPITPINMPFTCLSVRWWADRGRLPGFGPSAGLAILLPVTFGLLDPSARSIDAGRRFYYGVDVWRARSPPILLNTPGAKAPRSPLPFGSATRWSRTAGGGPAAL